MFGFWEFTCYAGKFLNFFEKVLTFLCGYTIIRMYPQRKGVKNDGYKKRYKIERKS